MPPRNARAAGSQRQGEISIKLGGIQGDHEEHPDGDHDRDRDSNQEGEHGQEGDQGYDGNDNGNNQDDENHGGRNRGGNGDSPHDSSSPHDSKSNGSDDEDDVEGRFRYEPIDPTDPNASNVAMTQLTNIIGGLVNQMQENRQPRQELTEEEKLQFAKTKVYHTEAAKLAIAQKLKLDTTFTGDELNPLIQAVKFKRLIGEWMSKNDIDEKNEDDRTEHLPRITARFAGKAKRLWDSTLDKKSYKTIKDWREKWFDVHFPTFGALKQLYDQLLNWRYPYSYSKISLTCTDSYELIKVDYDELMKTASDEQKNMYSLNDYQHVYNIVNKLPSTIRERIEMRKDTDYDNRFKMTTIQELKDNYIKPIYENEIKSQTIFGKNRNYKGISSFGRGSRGRGRRGRFGPKRRTNVPVTKPTIGTKVSTPRQVNVATRGKSQRGRGGRSRGGFTPIEFGKKKNWLTDEEIEKLRSGAIERIYVDLVCNRCKLGGHMEIACRWLHKVRPKLVKQMDQKYKNKRKYKGSNKRKGDKKRNKRNKNKDKKSVNNITTNKNEKGNDVKPEKQSEDNSRVVSMIQNRMSQTDKRQDSFLANVNRNLHG